MKRQTRIALVVVAAALAAGIVALHVHTSSLARTIASTGGAP